VAWAVWYPVKASGVGPAANRVWYQLTVPAAERLTAQVTASGGSGWVPRLTLAGPGGQVLIQSDGSIVQHLEPGTYYLAVSAASGAGTYRLTSEFVRASAPFTPIGLGNGPPTSPGKVVAADLNGDGWPDLVTANGNGTFSVLLGNGDGSFQPAQTITTGYGPYAVAVADVNGDGKPDIVATSLDDSIPGGTVSVLLGNGDGSLRLQQTVAIAPQPDAVAVVDVNGDGIPDIITANQGNFRNQFVNNVSVLLGDGDGSFGPPRTFALPTVASFNESMGVVDVNGDGIPDIVTSNYGPRGG
jgi:hypothetical protein